MQADCSGAIHQILRLNYKEANYYEIRTAQMNHCLDLSGNSSASGTSLVQWYCNGGYNSGTTLASTTAPVPTKPWCTYSWR